MFFFFLFCRHRSTGMPRKANNTDELTQKNCNELDVLSKFP